MFEAGSVYAILGAKLDPSGFAAYGAALDQAKGKAAAAEAAMVNSHERTARSSKASGAAAVAAAASADKLGQSSRRNAGLVTGLATASTRSSRAVGAMGTGAAYAGGAGLAALAVGLAKSVGKAAEFEAQLSSLKSVTGASAKEMKTLEKAALDAGAKTKYSALDAAQAQTELAKGGLSVSQIMKGGLDAALGLAAAGELELADAAATTANAMNLFGLKGKDATHIADALATAANATTADVGDFAMALAQGGSAAKAAGLSFDETVVALEALAKIGVKGSDAGTSLKAALSQIADPSKEAAGTMKKLGLDFFDAQGKIKPLPKIAENLRDSLGGLTKEQRLQALQTVAGTDGFRALLALYDQGPTKLRKLADGVKEQGTAAKVAKEKQDNLKGSMENLSGTIETIQIKIGQKLTPATREAADALNEFLQDLSNGKGGGGFADQVIDDAQAVKDAVADLADVLDTIGVDTAAGATISGIFGLISGGADIAAGSIKIVKSLLSGDLSGAADGAKQAIEGAFKGIAGAVDLVTSPLQALGDAVGVDLSAPFKRGADVILGLLSTLIDGIGDFAGAASKLPGIGGLFKPAANAAHDAADEINKLRDRINGLPDGKKTKIEVESENAEAALRRIKGVELKRKVMKVLGDDTDAQTKVKKLRQLGIPKKDAVVLGKVGDALSGIETVRGALARLRNRTVSVTVVQNVKKVGGGGFKGAAKAGENLLPKSKRATGRAAGVEEMAIVGDAPGGGSQTEYVVDGLTGAVTRVDRPTPWMLGSDDWVIPTAEQFAGRAAGLMLDLFDSMGATRYAPGKKGKSKKKGSSKALPIPDAVRFGAVDEGELTASRDKARERYTDKRDKINDAESDLRQAKDKKAREKARTALRKAKRGTSEATLRKRYRDLDQQVRTLHAYNVEIERLDTQQQTLATQMGTASKRKDAGAWTTAKGSRDKILSQLRGKYALALKLARPGTKFAADLESKLAGIDSNIADSATDVFSTDQPESPFDDGLSKGEKAELAGLEAKTALAALTEGLDDDKVAAALQVGFFDKVLKAAQADRARGGDEVIASLAGSLKGARDNLASLSGTGTNDNQDLQAQIDQANERARIAQEQSRIDSSALRVFQGLGDIGAAPTINQYMLHPGDPRTQLAVAEAAVSGMSYQGYRRSPRERVGI